MAKRTKLNLRAAMVLSTVVLFLIVGFVTWRIGKTIKPRNPAGLASQAVRAAEQNDFASASKFIGDAIAGDENNLTYFLQALRIYNEWSHNATLNDTEKNFRVKQANSFLEVALQKWPDDPELRSIEASMQWEQAIKNDNWDSWTRFAESADQALRTREDSEVRYRLAIANLRRSELKAELLEKSIADFKRAAEEGKKTRFWIGGPDRDNLDLTLQGYLPVVRLRKPASATEAFESAVRLMPDNAEIRVACGDYFTSINQPQKALEQYTQALQRQPGNAISKLALARFYSLNGDSEKAIQYAGQAKHEHPDDFRTYLEMSNVLNMLGRRDDAIKILSEGIAAIENWTPTQPTAGAWRTKRAGIIELNYALASTAIDEAASKPPGKADLKEAEKSLARLEQIDSNSFESHQISGRLALVSGQIAKAVTELDAAFKIRGSDTRTAGLLFDLYMSQGLAGKAEGVVARMEKSPELLGGPFVALCKALLAMKTMDYDAAIAQLFRIKDGNAIGAKAQELLVAVYRASGRTASLPADFKPSRQSVMLISERAEFLWKHDQHGKAVELLEELSAKAPADLTITSQLMRMYLDVGQIDRARAVLERALAAHPGDRKLMDQWELLNEPDPGKRFEMQMAIAGQNADPLTAEIRKAEICANFGKTSLAIEHLQAARKINPESPDAMEGLFNYYLSTKDWKSASEIANQAAQSNIDGLNGLFFKGRLAMAQDQAAQAVQAFRDIVRERPDNKVMRVLLGQACLKQYAKTNSPANLAAAQEAFKAVLAIDPVYPPALVGMAQTAQRMGKRAEQEEWIRKAWRAAPDDPFIREKFLELPEVAANPLEIVARRQAMMEKNPSDLDNAAALAALMEDPRIGRPEEAEKLYKFIYKASPDKLTAANMLLGFLIRSNRTSEAEEIFSQLQAGQKDRVGVLILRGSFLSNFNLTQARQAFEQAVQADPRDPRGYQALALLAIGSGDWAGAAAAIENLLKLDPENKAVRKDLILCQIEAGQYDSASRSIQTILTAEPADVVAITYNGLLLMRKGDFNGAMEALTNASRMSPDFAQPLAYRAQLYTLKGDLPKAIEDMKAAARMSADPAIALDYAMMCRQAWELDKAQTICKDIIAEHYSYSPAIRMLAGLYLLVGKWQELEELLNQAIAALPSDPAYLMLRARMCQARGNNEGRLAALKDAIRKFPKNQSAKIEYLLALDESGNDARIPDYLRENPAESSIAVEADAIETMAEMKLVPSTESRAQEKFKKLLGIASPEQLGFVTARIQQAYGLSAAADKADTWLSARPGDWRLMFLLGNMLSAAEKYDKAAAMFEKALQSADENPAKLEIELARAQNIQKSGDSRKAADILEQALTLAPEDVRCLNNLAFILADNLSDPNRAMELIQKAYRLAPGNADVMDTYGWTLAQLGRYEQAVEKLDPICRVFNPKAVYLYHLGSVRQKLGQTGKAAECFQKAIELAKDKDKNLCGMIEKALGRLQGRGD